MPVSDPHRQKIGCIVAASVKGSTGAVNYVVIARGRVGSMAKPLRAIPHDRVAAARTKQRIDLAASEWLALSGLTEGARPHQSGEVMSLAALSPDSSALPLSFPIISVKAGQC